MKKNTKITNASIESAGLPKDPKQVIAEYIWNGFDAKATRVKIDIISNEIGFIERIKIIDNGEGINPTLLDYSFGNFLDSLKKGAPKRSSYTRGKKGKGRFSFSLFATRATWSTVVKVDNTLLEYKLSIDHTTKEEYDSTTPSPSIIPQTGTIVELEGIFGLNSITFESEEFTDFLAQEFGWYLHLNKDLGYTIQINDKNLSYDQFIQETDTYTFTLYNNKEQSFLFTANYIRWKYAIGDKYYYYFLNSHNIEIAKALSSFNNNAINFHHSVYIESTFFDNFDHSDIALSTEGHLFSEKEQSVIYRQLMAELRDLLERKQKKYIREYAVNIKLKELLEKDLLPKYNATELDQKRKKTLVHLIQELYIIDPRIFVNVKQDLIRTYIAFLDLLLQTDRKSAIFPIIEQAIALTEKEKKQLNALLNA